VAGVIANASYQPRSGGVFVCEFGRLLLRGIGAIDHSNGAINEHRIPALRRRVRKKLTMRCLFPHKWARSVINVQSAIAYRTCVRCGTMQRGIFDRFWDDISWETIRERSYVKSQQAKIVRRPSSRLDQLAHSLGLRRSRTSDDMRSGKRSVQT